MKYLVLALGFSAPVLKAQVILDRSIHLTGPDSARTVQNIAPPTEASSLLSVGTWVSGSALWATVLSQGTTIQLATEPVTPLQAGSLLRFILLSGTSGNLLVQVDGSAPLPLVRPDGLPPVAGQLVGGMVAEIIHAGDRYVLMTTAKQGCPQGTVQVNGRYCIDINPGSALAIYEAVDRCAIRGGKLCTWDEYYYACHAVAAQLQGMFDDWEWVDDTANHVHLVVQAGRTTCMSQQTANSLTVPTTSRCCFLSP